MAVCNTGLHSSPSASSFNASMTEGAASVNSRRVLNLTQQSSRLPTSLSPSLNLPHPPQTQINIRPPAPKTLHRNSTAKILGIRSPQRQSIPQARQTAPTTRTTTNHIERRNALPAASLLVDLVLVESREAVLPELGVDFGIDATTAVADADCYARGAVVEGADVRAGGFV